LEVIERNYRGDSDPSREPSVLARLKPFFRFRYVRAYWRDGQYLNKRNYGKDKLCLLPRKVQRAFKETSSDPEVEELRMRLQRKMSVENQ
jgi:hypothetical protein